MRTLSEFVFGIIAGSAKTNRKGGRLGIKKCINQGCAKENSSKRHYIAEEGKAKYLGSAKLTKVVQHQIEMVIFYCW